MPFIDKFQCMYDGYNEVVEAKILDATPFKVTRMVPQRYNTGDRAPSAKCRNHSSADILDALRKCSEFIDGTSVATVATAEVKDNGNSVTPGGSIFDSEDSGSEAVPGTPIFVAAFSRVKQRLAPLLLLRKKHALQTMVCPNLCFAMIGPLTRDLPAAPIRVERRRKGKRPPNAFLDSRGVPDWQEEWEWLHEADYGKVLLKRKRMHSMRSSIDPSFNVPYDESIHGQYLRENLKISHLSPDKQAQLTALVKEYWPVFRPEDMSIPVLDYMCHIDTGAARP
eukprot:scaffold76080_cov21-Cyclotella_meneghiniana.AAC.1